MTTRRKPRQCLSCKRDWWPESPRTAGRVKFCPYPECQAARRKYSEAARLRANRRYSATKRAKGLRRERAAEAEVEALRAAERARRLDVYAERAARGEPLCG